MPDDRKPSESTAQRNRKARLAEELRANLMRRKAQTRSRRAGEADGRPEGLVQESADKDG